MARIKCWDLAIFHTLQDLSELTVDNLTRLVQCKQSLDRAVRTYPNVEQIPDADDITYVYCYIDEPAAKRV